MHDPVDLGVETRDLLYKAVPELRHGVWQLLSCDVEEALARRGRHLIFCRMAYRAGRGHPKMADLVVKVCGPGRGKVAAGALQRLAESGFHPPSVHLVPRLYGHSLARGALVQARAPGISWRTILNTDPTALPAASARAAAWLAMLHRTPAGVPSSTAWGRLISTLQMSEELLTAFPRHPALATALDAFHSYPQSAGRRFPLALSHGDFHPGQVLLAAHHVTVLDFDAFGLREPAFDIGYCIAQLLAMSYFGLREFAPGATAAGAFWTAYTASAALPSWARVRFHVARGFIQILHYARRTLVAQYPEMLAFWPGLITRCLTSDGPNVLAALVCAL